MASKDDIAALVNERHPDADQDTKRVLIEMLWEAHLDGKTIYYHPPQPRTRNTDESDLQGV